MLDLLQLGLQTSVLGVVDKILVLVGRALGRRFLLLQFSFHVALQRPGLSRKSMCPVCRGVREPLDLRCSPPAAVVIDAKALYDLLMQKDIPHLGARDKHTALEVLGLSQHLEEQETIVRWCNSDQQLIMLSDGMTKISAFEKILKYLEGGQRWSVVYDQTFTSVKPVKAAKTADADFLYSDPCWTDILWQTAGHVRFSGSGTEVSQPQHVIPGAMSGCCDSAT